MRTFMGGVERKAAWKERGTLGGRPEREGRGKIRLLGETAKTGPPFKHTPGLEVGSSKGELRRAAG